MTNLIEDSTNSIEKCLMHFNNPAIACSFGKDSLVLLHLIVKKMGYKMPVIFWKESFCPKKYAYANRIIEDWDLQVIDYPVGATGVFKKNGVMELVNYYTIGGKFMMMPMEVCEPKDGEPLLCGLRDIVEKPKGAFAFPYDLLFMGHKGSDVDPCHGAVPLHADINISRNAASTAYPMKDWSDEDVWNYIESEDLPIHHERYEKSDGKWQQKADRTYNHHYFPACVKCLDPEMPRAVHCPKMNLLVPNVSEQYLVPEPQFNYTGV
jgi:hypothetical protein